MPLDMTNWNEPERKEPSLEGLIEWLEGQEPSASYDYYCASYCVVGRFLAELGYTSVVGAPFHYQRDGEVWDMTNTPFHKVANPYWVGLPNGRTYGAALQRARALLRETAAAE